MTHLSTPIYRAKTPAGLPQAKLPVNWKRHIMKLRSVRQGDRIVAWDPRQDFHVHRVVKHVERTRYQTCVQFEDGGHAIYINGGKLMIDRRHR